jgi:hypothetical protein
MEPSIGVDRAIGYASHHRRRDRPEGGIAVA